MSGCALCLTLVLFVAPIPVAADPAAPSPIRDQLLVIPEGWSATIPPAGSVEAPAFLEALAPDQRFMLALVADGANRQRVLGDCRLTVRITSNDTTISLGPLHPVAVRSVLAEGAGMISDVLGSADIHPSGDERDALEGALSSVGLAAFSIDWVAPAIGRESEVRVDATVAGPEGTPSVRHATLRLRPWSEWRGDPEPGTDDANRMIAGFHKDLQPGRLLTLLSAAMRSGVLNQPTAQGFFVVAFRRFPAAKQAAIEGLPRLDFAVRAALLLVLRMAGDDVRALATELPPELRSMLDQAPQVGDPRVFPAFADPVDPRAAASLGVQADYCWGGWMATGDPSYLRALVGLLEGAPDYPALQAWQKARTGARGLTAAVARGLAYRVVGGSLASYRLSDPEVRGWLSYWKTDSALPESLRRQLEKLPVNRDFADAN